MTASEAIQSRLVSERVRDALAREIRDPFPIKKEPESTLVLDKEPPGHGITKAGAPRTSKSFNEPSWSK